MRKFRLGEPATAPAQRRFRLPATERAAAPFAPLVPIDQPVKAPPLQRASEREPYKYKAQVKAPARRVQAAVDTIRAPNMETKPIAVVSLRVASDLPMPGFMGNMTMQCDPASHDMRRLRLGVMPLLRQHDDDSPIGRVNSLSHVRESGGWAITGESEIADFPRAHEVLAEMEAGARRGVSPGFVVTEMELNDDFDMIVTKSEIYEVSIVTGARNYGARVLNMEAAMNGAQGSEVVHTSDMLGVSLSAMRVAHVGGQGSPKQRRKLAAFFRVFDDAIGKGESRDAAAQLAKAAAGLA